MVTSARFARNPADYLAGIDGLMLCYNREIPPLLRLAPRGAWNLPHSSRGVAQPGRAPGSGPGGRRFKSSLPDQYPKQRQ